MFVNHDQWCIQSFFQADRYTHQIHKGATMVCAEQRNFQKFVPPDTLKIHSLALSAHRFLCETFPKYLKFTIQKALFRWWFLKNSYIQIKNLYSFKIVKAAKESGSYEGIRAWKMQKYSRRNHKKQCILLFT